MSGYTTTSTISELVGKQKPRRRKNAKRKKKKRKNKR